MVVHCRWVETPFWTFQFYRSTIMVLQDKFFFIHRHKFQFYRSTIMVISPVAFFTYTPSFQFYRSTIMVNSWGNLCYDNSISILQKYDYGARLLLPDDDNNYISILQKYDYGVFLASLASWLPHFNSTEVRLWLGWCWLHNLSDPFQFYRSTIMVSCWHHGLASWTISILPKIRRT